MLFKAAPRAASGAASIALVPALFRLFCLNESRI